MYIDFIQNADAEARRRDPRLFFVTTESSTLSTTTMCWSINNVGCTGHSGGQCRRRRSISEDINSDGNIQINVKIANNFLLNNELFFERIGGNQSFRICSISGPWLQSGLGTGREWQVMSSSLWLFFEIHVVYLYTGCPTIEFSLCFACFLGFQCS